MQEYGLTPLHNAARYGHADVVKKLVAAGADTTIKNNDGKRAKDIATESVRLVFERRLRIGTWQCTPLFER